MARYDFFRRFGMVVIPDFLDSEECARLRELAGSAEGKRGHIIVEGQPRLDDEHRRTLVVPIKGAGHLSVEDKIEALRERLEQHFDLELGDTDPVQCLVYKPGDFFVLHADTAPVESGEYSYVGKRRVSVVVFLNDPNHPTEPYEGGALTFYGLMDVPGSRGYGFPIDPETGLLVAFPSVTLHEVSAITRGNRYTLVTWFWQKEHAQGTADPVAAGGSSEGRGGE